MFTVSGSDVAGFGVNYVFVLLLVSSVGSGNNGIGSDFLRMLLIAMFRFGALVQLEFVIFVLYRNFQH